MNGFVGVVKPDSQGERRDINAGTCRLYNVINCQLPSISVKICKKFKMLWWLPRISVKSRSAKADVTSCLFRFLHVDFALDI